MPTGFKTSHFIIAAIVGLTLFGVYKKLKGNSSKSSIQQIQTTAPVNSPLEKSVDEKNKGIAAGSTDPKPDISPTKNRLGLCAVRRPEGSQLIDLKYFRHFYLQHTKYLVLPSRHSSCFPSSGRLQMKIVDYDAKADFAYDYFGDIEVLIQGKVEYQSLNQMISQSKVSLQQLGFPSSLEVLRQMSEDYTGPNDPVVVLKIDAPKPPQIRDPIAGYSYLPNIYFINKETADLWVSQKKVRTVEFVDRPKEDKGDKEGEDKSLDDNQIDRAFLNRVAAKKLMYGFVPPLQVRKQLTSLFSKGSVAIIPSSANDMTAYNLLYASKLESKYMNYVVQSTERPAPQSVDELRTLDVGEFKRLVESGDLERTMIVDTRMFGEKKGYYLESAWTFPIPWSDKVRREEYLNPTGKKVFEELDADLFNNLAKKHKRVIIIGRDDFDFGPLHFFNRIRSESGRNISWLRAGFEGLELAMKLGLLEKEQIQFQSIFKNNDKVIKTPQAIMAKRPDMASTLIYRNRTIQAMPRKSLVRKNPIN